MCPTANDGTDQIATTVELLVVKEPDVSFRRWRAKALSGYQVHTKAYFYTVSV